MMKKDKFLKHYLNIATPLFFILVVFGVAILVGINLRFIYYIDLKVYQIEKVSGLPRNQILSIYHQLVNYLHPFYFAKFPITDPDLVSANSIKHFEEVKVIFDVIYLFFLIGIIGSITNYFIIKKQQLKFTNHLKVTCYFFFITISILLFCIIFFFDITFVVFHKIMFNNDLWLFTDNIIYLLPAEFFMHMAIAIGGVIIVICSCILITLKLLKKSI